ncbi:MAG: hypothetical protein QXY86_00940 [Candidatus Micrarchaeaceae archaeon]
MDEKTRKIEYMDEKTKKIEYLKSQIRGDWDDIISYLGESGLVGGTTGVLLNVTTKLGTPLISADVLAFGGTLLGIFTLIAFRDLGLKKEIKEFVEMRRALKDLMRKEPKGS